jgi:predicted acylesterase/phospholipase RssA
MKIDKFNLILSGGAALGYAHIGVLEYFNEKNLKPSTLHGLVWGQLLLQLPHLILAIKLK